MSPGFPTKTLRSALGTGIAVILAISTMLGVLFAKGPRAMLATVAVGCVVALASLLYLGWKQRPRPNLGVTEFAYPRPEWYSYGADHFGATCEITKAALVLMALDRTDSGLWGKSYILRTGRKSAAHGSLTGTPIALVAVHSILGDDSAAIHDWTSHPLVETLTSIIDDDGRYVRGPQVVQMGTAPEFEPPRHAAGGCHHYARWHIRLQGCKDGRKAVSRRRRRELVGPRRGG